MTEVLNIDLSANKQEPSLEEQAKAAGISVGNVDPQAIEQTAKEPAQKILGKFEDYEALEAAYKELEKKLGANSGNKEEAPAQRTEQDGETSEPQTTETQANEQQQRETAEEAVKKAGLDLNEVSQRYWQNGEKLDAADYEKLESSGYPKGLVDQYIAGVQATRTLARNNVFNAVGGEENYSSMLDWAKSSFSTDEVKSYNDAVNSGDMGKTMFAVNSLKARYEAVRGLEPSNPISGKARTEGGGRYDSMAQVMEDMRNPKYNTDPAFRKQVENKLARSDI